MKKLVSRIVLVGSFVLISASASFAQTSANATASASAAIIAPITISSDVNMDFGSIVPGISSGTVSLATDGTPSSSGGVTVVTTGQTAASFTAQGEANTPYTITLPVSVTITNTGGAGETMTIDNFVSSPAAGSQTFGGSGTQIINVGARLNVDANQVPGTYTNASGIEVTVDYN